MKNNVPVNLDLSTAQDVTCDKCGNYSFQEVVLMKKVSALVSPTGKEGIVPIPTFACNACGFINKQFLPIKLSEQQEKRQQSLMQPESSGKEFTLKLEK